MRGERWEKEYVGAKRDHLRAKKPSGDLWTLRTDRRAEWADAQRWKLSVDVSQAADKCWTIADKAQNDNTWRPKTAAYVCVADWGQTSESARAGRGTRTNIFSLFFTWTLLLLLILLYVGWHIQLIIQQPSPQLLLVSERALTLETCDTFFSFFLSFIFFKFLTDVNFTYYFLSGQLKLYKKLWLER